MSAAGRPAGEGPREAHREEIAKLLFDIDQRALCQEHLDRDGTRWEPDTWAQWEDGLDGVKFRAMADAVLARSETLTVALAEAQREVARLTAWVSDLQAGQYVNCVYCGHRYGPGEASGDAGARGVRGAGRVSGRWHRYRARRHRDELICGSCFEVKPPGASPRGWFKRPMVTRLDGRVRGYTAVRCPACPPAGVPPEPPR